VIDAIQDTTELIDELARKGFRRGIDMVYTQVEGGEHNQATWGFILPYFLRWTFPTQRYVQQHPLDGRDFISVQMKGREVSHPRGKTRKRDAQSTRLLRVAAKKSRITKRRSRM
jgi:hypothetical protein